MKLIEIPRASRELPSESRTLPIRKWKRRGPTLLSISSRPRGFRGNTRGEDIGCQAAKHRFAQKSLGNFAGHMSRRFYFRLEEIENAEFRRPQLDCEPNVVSIYCVVRACANSRNVRPLALFPARSFEADQYCKLINPL